MSEINHEFWDNLFASQTYENINHNTILNLIECTKGMQDEILKIQHKFKKTYDFSFQQIIEQKKSTEDISEEVQNNIACTTATQRNTKNDAEAEENIKFSEELQEKITDDEKSELIRDDKYLQFVELMYQDEIKRIMRQQMNYWRRHYSKRRKVQFAVQIEYFLYIINLMNQFLELEDKVLNIKLDRQLMTTKKKNNMSCKVDYEKSKLMIDNKYLRFTETIRQKEINRIVVQLQMYRDIYNMPNEEVKIAMHKNFIVQRIVIIKSMLKLEAIDFDLQIEREAMNMDRDDVGSDNVKNTLMKNNGYLRYIAKKHQEEIDRIYIQLQMFCNKYYEAIENVKMLRKIDDKNELRKNNEDLRSVRIMYQKEFIQIYDQLQMYRDKYDMKNKNVTIVMHTKPYSMKTHDKKDELMRDNEYLAFIAMMHLEKINEICFFFQMYRNRFSEIIENIAAYDNFMKQIIFVINDLSSINAHIPKLHKELELIVTCEKLV
ncbi:uncharacterized protein LOC114934249 [Nylanderia fulva]|uniref:uncharacterized protein LOC114934249 n=1 Tax=Nylanderia fulva TaxID=613905 RepID=UPI0010FB12C7|nr:uncharacterized protein LOC114934249 [Nylanderia fulva]